VRSAGAAFFSASERVEVRHRFLERDIEGDGRFAVRKSVTSALTRTPAIIWSARVVKLSLSIVSGMTVSSD